MELKSYLRILKSERRLILACGLVAALSAGIFSAYAPTSYDTSVSLFLHKSGSQATDQFKYDGYYALDSGKVLSDNIEKLLQSPQVVDAIYRESEVDPAFRNLKSYKKKFTAHKMSNLYVEVSFAAQSEDDARNIAGAITRVVNRQLETMDRESAAEIAFRVENADPIVVASRPDPWQNGLLGLVSGLLLGGFAAFLKKYFAK